MLDKIRAAIKVLQHGEELTHAETWKQRQNLLNALVAVLGALVVLLPDSIVVSPEDVGAIAGGVAALAGIVNSYLTTATSARIGVRLEAAPTLPPGDGHSA